MASRSPFTTITTEGGLLPTELLSRLAQQPDNVPGTRPDDYHLTPGRRLRDAVNRSWTELQGAWEAFQTELAKVPTGERATTLTRERWLLPLFTELGFGRLPKATTITIDGRDYPVSHMWGAVPIHLLGADIELDRRTKGVAGAATAAPHSMLQELLNRSDEYLWGLVSNGRRLRLLRDNTSLTRASYVEFDLEAMFAGQVFTDFAVLWMVCHQSRFEADRPELCWLERWVIEARQQGVRALDTLRAGFEHAITTLGGGFLAHPANSQLRDRLRSGELTADEYQRQILRLVYRLVFLLVAEDRDLLHPPGTTEQQRSLYTQYYSLSRVRDHARRHRGGRHSDLWESLKPVFVALDTAGIPQVGLPPLGSFLWSGDASPDLDQARLANSDLLAAVRHLAYTERDQALNRVDFANLGPEELGSVYESLLELHPRVEADAARFELVAVSGNERKTTGSYYTPTSLISSLLDTALDPVLDEAGRANNAEAALLSLKVLDPACGSGHFLIAAGERIATRLASERTGELAPPPEAVRHALRDVVGRCLYGIDLNPMAVELCKVNLWLAAVEPGRPLSFLDHHVVRGNGLLGTTPALLAAGIPDAAYKPLTGDEKKIVTSLRTRNARERAGQGSLFDTAPGLEQIALRATQVGAAADDTVSAVAVKAAQWRELIISDEYRQATAAADTWCVAFVAPKRHGAPEITQRTLQAAMTNPERLDAQTIGVIRSETEHYGFLHPHLAFPDVYGPTAASGFDVVIGNPPWERVKLSEKEFFAARAPEIAQAAGAKRKALVAKIQGEDPDLWDEYQLALRVAEGESHFLRSSGRYPLCGRGDVNTYAVFAEAARDALAPTGREGIIVPTGIATDDTTKAFFADCVSSHSLVSLFGFENAAPQFPGVHRNFLFCLLTVSGSGRPTPVAEFAFFLHQVEEIQEAGRRFELTPEELVLINPNTRTAPVLRSQQDAEIAKEIYRNVPVLLREGDPAGNPWGIDYQTMFHMTNDSHLFRSGDELEGEGAVLDGNVWRVGTRRWLPLYEGKMIHHFNHRWSHASEKSEESIAESDLANPAFVVQPRYWVEEAEVDRVLRPKHAKWMVGFRGITNGTNERTMIAAAIPFVAAGNNLPLLNPAVAPNLTALLPAVLSSFVHDYAARFKIGWTNMNLFIVKQLPVVAPELLVQPCAWDTGVGYDLWLASRVLELTYSTWDMAGFAVDLGWSGSPFVWNPKRRMLLRAEIDAAFFHLFGLARDEVDHIMDTFPVARRADEKVYGEFRTKRFILERYDAMTDAVKSGERYETPLRPPPADPSMSHKASER